MLSVLSDCIIILIFVGKSNKKWISELKVKCDIATPLAASHIIAIGLSDPTGLDILQWLNKCVWERSNPFVQPVRQCFKLDKGKHCFWSCV